METFTAAAHHDVLLLLVQIAVLLLTARGLGEVAQRLNQPSVVGEILAGILLGPSLLSSLFPALGSWIMPQTPVQGYLLEVVSLLGVMFLLLITGLETDLALIRRQARTAVGASLGGILVPFISGFVLGYYLPDVLLVRTEQRLIFALFLATAMSISAIPVIAKVLIDMKLMRRDVGQTILAAGMVDDAMGWILLSIVAGLAAGAQVSVESVLWAVAKVALFIAFSFTFGRWLVKRSLDFVQDEVRSRDRLLTLVIVLTFVWGSITQALNLEAVLGAFFMGILFGQMPRLPNDVVHKLESMTMGIFAPIFFAVAGLKVHVLNLFTPQLMAIALLVILVATFGKFVGAYVGVRFMGRRDPWTALSLGAGMNARGAMEIIVATIGLQLGILSQEMFSIIVLMAMVTSLMAPPILRWTLSRITPEPQELERLRQEELFKDSVVAQIHRVLVPVRRRDEPDAMYHIKTYLLDKLNRHAPLSVTLFNVCDRHEHALSMAFLDQLAKELKAKEVTKKVVEARAPVQAILDEALKDYHLIVLGATEEADRQGALFHPIIDEMVRLAPCPTLVVKGGNKASHWLPKRLMVPTNGSVASQHAAEIAYLLADEPSHEVLLLSVMQRPSPENLLEAALLEREREVRRQILDELVARAVARGVRARSLIETGAEVETVIVDVARREGVDLILLGTDVRPGSDRLFLGPRVERILNSAPCPVVVFNAS
ncbi:cation:proton antiporter [Rhodothermus bifroesti]|uniref:Sodium:proton antiporter n=1 Tax=Rhodothermus marinus TaxID=29549 RepID=A0A7V2B0C8_RHOMR|nr:cation:proton antiporter [Rhodothermus bifroesti]